MKKIFATLLFVLMTTVIVEAVPPVDITLLMIEYKYNEEQGIKICEIQPVSQSYFSGYDYLHPNGEAGLIGKHICKLLEEYGNTFWFVEKEIASDKMREQFKKHGWHNHTWRDPLLRSEAFLSKATQPVSNPHDLRAYHGFLYMQPVRGRCLETFRRDYPGIVLLDVAATEYRTSKLLMAKLFDTHPLLHNFRPQWGLYKKNYHKDLANKISADIGSDILVIKPVSSASGNGVIMVDKKDLDATLKTILNPNIDPEEYAEVGYSYWPKDRNDSFLVEEFIASDPILVPEFYNKFYDCTMRCAVALIYHQGAFRIHFLGEYWDLPDKPLSARASLTDKHKSSLETARSIHVDSETKIKHHALLTQPLILLYKRMLDIDIPSHGLNTSSVTVTES